MKLRANEKIATSTLCLTVKVGIHRVMGSWVYRLPVLNTITSSWVKSLSSW